MFLYFLKTVSLMLSNQVTTQQADAADEDTIAGICKQALQDEGRLDVFFANVRDFSRELTHVAQRPRLGWHCYRYPACGDNLEAVYGSHARQRAIVSPVVVG